MPFLTRPSVVARLAGAIGVLDARGFDTVVRNVETAAQRDRQLAALTARHEADGAVIVSLRLTSVHLAALRTSRLPLTMVDSEAPGVPSTLVDDVKGGWLATEHLVRFGHCRIAFIGDERGSSLDFLSTRRRLLGYRRALTTTDWPTTRPWCGWVSIRRSRGPAGGGAILRYLPPTAIFAASDTQALGVLAAAEKHGRAVPADLSVIGFDDLDSAAQLGLSTVHQPLADSGARGASRLCALIAGQQVRPLREELPLSVVPRRSTTTLRRPAGRCDPARPHPVPLAGLDKSPANRYLADSRCQISSARKSDKAATAAVSADKE